MAAAKRRRQAYRVEGTSARQPEYAPEREYDFSEEAQYAPQKYIPERKQAPKRGQPSKKKSSTRRKQSVQQERQKAPHLASKSVAPVIDFFGMLVLLVAIGATFAVCISYLQVQAAIDSKNKEISRLENQTEELIAKNDYTELNIQNSIDLEQIQKAAIEELGMVYPYNNQMITYETKKSGYVRQYGELTGNEQESLIELLLRMLLSSKKAGDSAVSTGE